MQRTNILILIAIVVTSLFFSERAAAQSVHLVEIVNESFEPRKICFYKDGTGVAPYKCFELLHGEKAVWNREQDTAAYFNLKVFKPALIDKRLHYRRLSSFTNKIVMGTGTDLEITRAARYRLKVCNQGPNQKVFFVLHFETDKSFLTEGWWSVAKGKCVEFAVSDKLNQRLNLEYGSKPRIYMYAQTFTKDPKYWTGGLTGLKRCVDRSDEFRFVHPGVFVGDVPPEACASRQKLVSFRPIASPRTNEVYYYLTF